MEHEKNAEGARGVLLAFFAFFIAAVVIVLGGFVMRRLGEAHDVCAVEIVSKTGVCGE